MAKAKTKPALSNNQFPLLQNRLILNRFFCRQLGFEKFKDLRDYLRLGGHTEQEGWGDDGHHVLFHVIRNNPRCLIPSDRLAEYDLRINEYLVRLNRFRTPPVQLKYFQYLAVLFTEIYLDRLFNEKENFLAELNAFVAQENEKLSSVLPYPFFTEEDLNKLAFWMATGSGKTLIMHINLWQYLRYSKREHDNILLITPPGEGLSRQHLEEFRKSGIPARHYKESNGFVGFFDGKNPSVTVIEITKLTESKRGGGLSVEVDAFGSNNLLFVDEGHRGASGETWRELRRCLAEHGFTFEYSATFGQIVNGASKEKRRRLLEEYSKAIIFDYSYPHFHEDGYGKDYFILNLKDETNAFNDWMLLGNLMSFYEQCLVYEEHRNALLPYNIEKPLWVFVGHSVTGGKSQEDKNTMTDVQEIIAFFQRFLSEKDTWTARIEKAIKGETGLEDQSGEDIFRNLFPYLKEKNLTSAEIYDGILQRVFHFQAGGTLRAAELKAASGEIGLRTGMDSPYFGVINIGDVPKLMKLLAQQGIPCEQENITGSLFDRINDPQSPVNVLIGSRKFMEGWDSFRVASMGLLNIGKGEGSQIIQLFGRGVRLWGKDRSLKRSSALPADSTPPYIRLLETLNVFGVRANYMAQFREYLKQEGIETDFEEIFLPVRIQKEFLERGLQVLRLPEGKAFHREEGVVLELDPDLRVTLDLRPQIEAARSDMNQEVAGRTSGEDHAGRLKELVPLLDWEHIYFDLLEFKRTRGFYNLSFTPLSLRRILEHGYYTVFCPTEQLSLSAFTELRRVHEIAKGVLRKYAAAFYDRRRRAWGKEQLRLQTLTESDPNLSFGGYTLRVKRDFVEHVRELVERADELYTRDMKNFPNIHFDRHLYQPLLVADEKERLESVPPGLNEGERKFVDDLRKYVQQNGELLRDKEVFLLRNLTRGKGIGFFETGTGEAFYPDFILWVIENAKQWITFIDPHGLRYAKGGFNDSKIRLHADLKALELTLQQQCTQWQVYLSSFILSTSRYDEIKKIFPEQYSQEEFEKHNILFIYDDSDYIRKLLRTVLEDADSKA
jgi:hypothetical protein